MKNTIGIKQVKKTGKILKNHFFLLTFVTV